MAPGARAIAVATGSPQDESGRCADLCAVQLEGREVTLDDIAVNIGAHRASPKSRGYNSRYDVASQHYAALCLGHD